MVYRMGRDRVNWGKFRLARASEVRSHNLLDFDFIGMPAGFY